MELVCEVKEESGVISHRTLVFPYEKIKQLYNSHLKAILYITLMKEKHHSDNVINLKSVCNEIRHTQVFWYLSDWLKIKNDNKRLDIVKNKIEESIKTLIERTSEHIVDLEERKQLKEVIEEKEYEFVKYCLGIYPKNEDEEVDNNDLKQYNKHIVMEYMKKKKVNNEALDDRIEEDNYILGLATEAGMEIKSTSYIEEIDDVESNKLNVDFNQTKCDID